METANLYNFLRNVFFFVMAYYILKFLAKLLFPMLVKKAVQHAEDNMRQQFGQYQNFGQQQQRNDDFRKRDGEVSYDSSEAAKSKETKKVGEYIDYEEID